MNALEPMKASPRTKPSQSILLGLLVGLCVLVAFVIALFGVWVGTTLAVYSDGPVWLAVVGAVVCFAIVPLVWELVADREQVGGRIRDAILRSSFLSLAFVTVLVATHPKVAFEALATRGDWFLGGSTSPTAESIRKVLHTAANGLEWLNDMVRPKEFRLEDDDPDQIASESAQPDPQPSSTPVVVSSLPVQPSSVPQTRDGPSLEAPTQPEPVAGKVVAYKIAGTDLTWPLPPEVHPAVRDMPEEAKKSIATVGKYLKETVSDPLMRVKAIHDFVATWVAYDAVGLSDGSYKRQSQEAKAVFERRSSVCAGYAKLMVGIAKVTGDEVVYVGGDSRSVCDYAGLDFGVDVPRAKGIGHAWNAAKIGGQWYLIDATWDAGSVSGTEFKPAYKTEYLFIPPEIMIVDHIPDAERFQLLPVPLDRAAWMRQPFVEPLGLMLGLKVLEPTAPLSTVSEQFVVKLENPSRNWLYIKMSQPGGDEIDCNKQTNGAQLELTCPIKSEGRVRAWMFANDKQYGQYQHVMSFVVDGTP